MQTGRPLLEHEASLLTAVREIQRGNVARCSEALRHIAAIAAALAGSGVYFLSGSGMSRPFVVAFLASLMLSLAISIIGFVPTPTDVAVQSITSIEQYFDAKIRSKRRYLLASGLLLLLSLCIGMIGTVANLAS